MLDDAATRSRRSRSQTYDDFLTLSMCALSGGQMEEEYLEVAAKYVEGEQGKRSIDLLADTFGQLILIMEETRADVLGDFFTGAITFGENGQFFTPNHITDMMAKMVGNGEGNVFDPCCGSGRMLLSASEVNRNREFFGQDIDLRCVKMTAINLSLRNLYGFVIWGDSLLGQTGEQKLVYRTGFNGRGFIEEVPKDKYPVIQRPEPEKGFETERQPDVEIDHFAEQPISQDDQQLRLF